MSERRCLILFARAPEAGKVKTRLAASLGTDRALALYTRMLAHQVALVNSMPKVTRHLSLLGDAEHPAVKAFQGRVLSQCDGNIGKRMAYALAEALAGHDQAVLIGCVSPGLDALTLEAAFAALAAGQGAVFAPALDGGYVLVGLRQPQVALFTGIDWGTSQVMSQTRARLQQAALDWHELPAQPDIDIPEDLVQHAELVASVFGAADKH